MDRRRSNLTCKASAGFVSRITGQLSIGKQLRRLLLGFRNPGNTQRLPAGRFLLDSFASPVMSGWSKRLLIHVRLAACQKLDLKTPPRVIIPDFLVKSLTLSRLVKLE
jgi:hypothetical protein